MITLKNDLIQMELQQGSSLGGSGLGGSDLFGSFPIPSKSIITVVKSTNDHLDDH